MYSGWGLTMIEHFEVVKTSKESRQNRERCRIPQPTFSLKLDRSLVTGRLILVYILTSDSTLLR